MGKGMLTGCISICLMIVAFLVTTLIFPFILAIARKHNIVDNPNARKLQRVPVPVMGGTTVVIGFLAAVFVGQFFYVDTKVLNTLALLFVMYVIGAWDDIKDISASLRFVVELVVVWMIILLLDVELNDFHGVWGLHVIPDAISVPLSLVAGVGIMNAVNLIDGVDGYCSTYGVMSCGAFATIFYISGDMMMYTLALIEIGAVIPFFFHNVFGKTSKMFLGDGGSLMLGTLLTVFTFSAVSDNSVCNRLDNDGLSIIALTLAIMAVPVFDTLRVMMFRMFKGVSPFHPDKTHLHHLFIEMNFSHLATSGIIVLGNTLIVALLLLVWRLGAPIDYQVYTVLASALLFTWAFYFFMEWQHKKNDGQGSRMFQRWCKRGKTTNISQTATWQLLSKIVDSKFLAGTPVESTSKSPEITASETKVDPRV